jgi:alpha-tubulin suppressor-like RCC1 family protein
VPGLGWKACALLGVAMLTFGACGGGNPQGTGPAASGQPTGSSGPTGSGGLPTIGPTPTAGGTSGATATPMTTSSGVPTATQTAPSGASDAVAIAAGAGHACALISNGGVMCWGGNWRGQLGNGTIAPNGDATLFPPAYVLGLTSGVQAIAADGDATCALMTAGNAKCWGSGAVGNGATEPAPAPVDVIGLSGANGIFTGSSSFADGFCATVSGALKCWGQAFNSGISVAIAGITDASAVGLSNDHFCVLISNGSIKCWGKNNFGQLGNGSTTDSPTPVDVVGLTSPATAVITGLNAQASGFACALSNGGVKCWGMVSNPDGTHAASAIPVDVPGFTSGVGSLVVNGGAICAITTGGIAKCWGDTYYHPELISSLTLPVKSLALNGTAMLCALTTDNHVVCYSYVGADRWPVVQGLLASAAAGQTPPPAAVGTTSAISLDNGHGACVLTKTGGLKCWGTNPGNGTAFSATAVDVLGLTTGVGMVSAGNDHRCALTTAGGVKCWGNNNGGQLGNGTTSNSLIPVDVTGLASGASAIAVEDQLSCAIIGGGVKCWGHDQQTPTDFAGLGSGVTQLAMGYGTSGTYCALVSGGATCWSQLPLTPPTAVAGLPSGLIVVSSGLYSNCAVTSAGAVKCWTVRGGTIGAPLDVPGLASGVVDVRVGYNGACALLSTGGVKCWGGNLGNGTTGTSATPVDVAGLADVTAIAMDYADSCAVTSTHVLKCWGTDYGTAPVDVAIDSTGP